MTEGVLAYRPSNDGRPKIVPKDTPYGFRYGAIRRTIDDGNQSQYVRTTLFAAPCYSFIPAPSNWGFFQAFVPIEDERTLFFFIKYRLDAPITDPVREEHMARSGFRRGVDLNDQFENIRSSDNNWLQDREAMSEGSFSGIRGVQNEDTAVQESMGPLYDRRHEHLGPTDLAIIHMRRLMLHGLEAFLEGSQPPGLAEPVAYELLHAEERVLPLSEPWDLVGMGGSSAAVRR
jgi:phthalate 4,5-dioxygenase oxygenase subunit